MTFAPASGNTGTITQASGSWSDYGFQAGESIVVSGTTHDDGTYDIQVVSTSIKGWATLRDGVLTMHLVNGDDRGFAVYQLDREFEHGKGIVVMTEYNPETQLGNDAVREGRKVREIPDCTLRRIGR